MDTLNLIKQREIQWAKNNHITVSVKGYVEVSRIEKDNLFEPLSSEARHEFLAGGGNELKTKMAALHSSSALACNVFHYWRLRKKVGIITSALGLYSNHQYIKFEADYKKPSEIAGKNPFLDVEITGNALTLIAIESKFTEPYTKKLKTFHEKYNNKSHIWYPCKNCQLLVNSIINGNEKFYRLDAPQLLKHIMGLLNTMDHKPNFKLYYLWYRVPGKEADEHDDEIKRFISLIGRDIDFHVMTYQELFPRITALAGAEDSAYINYLKERYFS